MTHLHHVLPCVLVVACAESPAPSPEPEHALPIVAEIAEGLGPQMRLDGSEQRAAPGGGRHLILHTTALRPGLVSLDYETGPTPSDRRDSGTVQVSIVSAAAWPPAILGPRIMVGDTVELQLWTARWAWEYRLDGLHLSDYEPRPPRGPPPVRGGLMGPRFVLPEGLAPPACGAAPDDLSEALSAVEPQLTEPHYCPGRYHPWSRAVRWLSATLRLTAVEPGPVELPPMFSFRSGERSVQLPIRVQARRARVHHRIASHPWHAGDPPDVELRVGEQVSVLVARRDRSLRVE